MKKIRLVAVGMLVSTAAWSGCSSSSPSVGQGTGGSGSGTSLHGSGVLGPAGGRITSPDGVLVVTVPPGALPASITLSIAVAPSAPGGTVGPAYEIGPTGTEFAQPVSLAFHPALLPSDDASTLYVATVAGGTWQPLAMDTVDPAGTVTAFTSHLSQYGVLKSNQPKGQNAGCACDVTCFSGACSQAKGSVVGSPEACTCEGQMNDRQFAYTKADAYEACSKTQTDYCTPAIRACCGSAQGWLGGGQGYCSCSGYATDPMACLVEVIKAGTDKPEGCQGAGDAGAGGAGGAGPCVGPVPSGDGAVFALSKVFLGDTNPDGTQNTTNGWKQYGVNLDGKVSTKDSKDVCKPAGGASPTQAYPDGNNGIDNAWGKNILPIEVGLASDVSTKANAGIAAGESNFLLHLVGAGAGADTCGLATRFYLGSKLDAPPKFDGTDVWPVDPSLLSAPGEVTSTKLVFASTDVVGNMWRTNTPGTVIVRLAGDSFPFELTITHARMRMKLSADHASAEAGMIGGILDTEQYIQQFKQLAGAFDKSMCSGGTIDGVANQIRQASDILKDGTQDPNKTCDGISIGLGFEAIAVKLGGVGPVVAPPANPCAP